MKSHVKNEEIFGTYQRASAACENCLGTWWALTGWDERGAVSKGAVDGWADAEAEASGLYGQLVVRFIWGGNCDGEGAAACWRAEHAIGASRSPIVSLIQSLGWSGGKETYEYWVGR